MKLRFIKKICSLLILAASFGIFSEAVLAGGEDNGGFTSSFKKGKTRKVLLMQ